MGAPDSIRVDYVENEEFFLEAYDRLPVDIRVGQRSPLVSLVLIMVTIGLTAYYGVTERHAGNRLWWMALIFVPAVFALMWFWLQSRWMHRRGYARGVRQAFEGKSRNASATFDEDGFVAACEDGRSKTHLWRDVPRVVVRTDGCFVFLDGLTFFWFPRRVFARETDFERLKTLLQQQVPKLENANV